MLQKVVVSELFGLIDHELNINASITLFSAANGYGKTTLLQLIDAFYCGDLPYIVSIEFDQLTFIFPQQTVTFVRLNSSQLTYTISDNQSGQISEPYHFDSSDFSEDLSPSELADICEKISLSADTQIDIWGNDDYAQTCHVATVNQHPEAVDWHQQLYPDTLKQLLGHRKSQFIDAKRENYDFILSHDSYDKQELDPLSLIEHCANDLVCQFANKLDQYHDTSEKLDATFATRLIDINTNTGKLSPQSLLNQYQTLHQTITQIIAFGLLPELDPPMPKPQSLRQDDQKLLALFVQDSKIKFAPYQKLMEKLQLFSALVNANLTFKSLTIDANLGFDIRTDSQQHIELNQLSDGEQQLIVLLYQIVMLCDDNQLILIDTPETGLDANWQLNLKPQLLELNQQFNCKFIIASHSAHIVKDEQALQSKRCSHCGHIH